MPGFNVADNVTCLLNRVNFVGRPPPAGMQKTGAFRAGEGVKASRIQIIVIPCVIVVELRTLFVESRSVFLYDSGFRGGGKPDIWS
jgi:hypothetical protein